MHFATIKLNGTLLSGVTTIQQALNDRYSNTSNRYLQFNDLVKNSGETFPWWYLTYSGAGLVFYTGVTGPEIPETQPFDISVNCHPQFRSTANSQLRSSSGKGPNTCSLPTNGTIIQALQTALNTNKRSSSGSIATVTFTLPTPQNWFDTLHFSLVPEAEVRVDLSAVYPKVSYTYYPTTGGEVNNTTDSATSSTSQYIQFLNNSTFGRWPCPYSSFPSSNYWKLTLSGLTPPANLP